MIDIQYPIEDLIEESSIRMIEIVNNMERVSTQRLGLDVRAGRVYASREGIVVENRYRGPLEYYGGFEYVNKECVHTIGMYTFYSRNDDRVEEAINYFMHELDKVDE